MSTTRTIPYCNPNDAGDGIIFVTPRISRQDRECHDCGTTIRKGERYERVFWIHDGDARWYATHDLDARCAWMNGGEE